MDGLKGAFADVFAAVRDDLRVDAAANAIDDGIKDEGLGQHQKGCNDVSYSQGRILSGTRSGRTGCVGACWLILQPKILSSEASAG